MYPKLGFILNLKNMVLFFFLVCKKRHQTKNGTDSEEKREFMQTDVCLSFSAFSRQIQSQHSLVLYWKRTVKIFNFFFF